MFVEAMTYEVLTGLPAYGEPPIQFDDNPPGSEGLVVRFIKSNGASWIGNFIGSFGVDTVFELPNSTNVFVVARGDLYMIEVESRSLVQYISAGFQTVFHCPEHEIVIFGTYTEFVAIGKDGIKWESKRISWDGFQNLECDCKTIKGEAWNVADVWMPFVLDLETGRHTGGAFE